MYPSSVSFTHDNWNVNQSVYIEGQYDMIEDGDVDYSITFQYRTEWTAGQPYGNDPQFERYHWRYPLQNFSLTNLDSKQTPANMGNGLVIEYGDESKKYTSEAGGEVELFVYLQAEPNWNTETVIFDVFTSDATEGVVMYPSSVIFTHQNWNIAQPVFIKGMYDDQIDGDKAYNISFSYVTEGTPGAQKKSNDPSFSRYHFKYPIQSVELINYDSMSNTTNGTSNGLVIVLAPDSLDYTTEAGGVVELLLTLQAQPNWLAETVVFNVFTSDATEGVVMHPSTIGFTRDNWNISQPVFIKGMFDEEQDGDVPYKILFEYQAVYTEGNSYLNDPDFMRDHYRYPVQTFEITNIDTYGSLRATIGTEVGKGGGYTNNDGSLRLRSRLNVTLANESKSFTTEAGATVELRAKLDTPVYEGSTVSYTVSTSDSTEATVDNPQILFDYSNWDIPVPVVVRGEWDAVLDGDIEYTVDFTLQDSDDPLYSRTHYTDPGVSVVLQNIDSYENSSCASVNSTRNQLGFTEEYLRNNGGVWPCLANNGENGDLIVNFANSTYSVINDAGMSYKSSNKLSLGKRLKTNHRADVDQSAYTSTFTTESGGMVALEAKLSFAPSVLAPDGVSFVVGVSDPTEAAVFYPSTLHFTRDNWYMPQLVYIVGLWDGRDDRDVDYDVTFTLDQHGTAMDPFFSRRLYTYPGTKFPLVNRHVSHSTGVYFHGFTSDSSNDQGLDSCATAYAAEIEVPSTCVNVYTQPYVILPSSYEDSDGRGTNVGGGSQNGYQYCMDNCFTTEAGGVTYASVFLTEQPSVGSYVQYGIAVSDPTEAHVIADAANGGVADLVFTHDNWNLGIEVAIQGVADCATCGRDEDGDINYFVDLFLVQTNDKNFTDIEGARLPLKNQDQVKNRLAVATDYNCRIADQDDTGVYGNYHGTPGGTHMLGGTLIQQQKQCWDPNVTATWLVDQTARYDYAGDRVFVINYDTPYGAVTDVPTSAPTVSKQPVTKPTASPTSSSIPTPVPTAHPTWKGGARDFQIGCVLDEAGENPCALQLTICQASTDAAPFDQCDVVLEYLDTYGVGVEAIVIDLWLDDPSEATFVEAPTGAMPNRWYDVELTSGSRYCNGTNGTESRGNAIERKVDYYGSEKDETRPCTQATADTDALAEQPTSSYKATIRIGDASDMGPTLDDSSFESSGMTNYSVPIWLKGTDDNIIDGDQMFRITTRAYVVYEGGQTFPDWELTSAGTCEPSKVFPLGTYMGDSTYTSNQEDEDCYLSTIKHYDMIQGLNETFFYAITVDDDEAPKPQLVKQDECAAEDSFFETTEGLSSCKVAIVLTAQPQEPVHVTVFIDNPEVDCSVWDSNVACEGQSTGYVYKSEAKIALEDNVEGTLDSYTVTLTTENWDTGVFLYIVGVDDEFFEQVNYVYGGTVGDTTESNYAGLGNTVPYHVVLLNSTSRDTKFDNMEEVKYLFHNEDDEAGSMSIFTSADGADPALSKGSSSEYSVFGAPTTSDKGMTYPQGGIGYSVDENGRYQYFGVKYVDTELTNSTQFIEVPVFMSVCNVEKDKSACYQQDAEYISLVSTTLENRTEESTQSEAEKVACANDPDCRKWSYAARKDTNGNPMFKLLTGDVASSAPYADWTGAVDPTTGSLVGLPTGSNNLLAVNITNMYDCVLDYDQVASGKISKQNQSLAYENLWWNNTGEFQTFENNIIESGSSHIGCMRIYEKNYWQYGKYTGLDDGTVQDREQYTRGRTAQLDFGPTIVWDCADPNDVSSGCTKVKGTTDSDLTYSLKITNVDNDLLEVSKTSCTTTEISGTNRTYLNPTLYYYDSVVQRGQDTSGLEESKPYFLPTPIAGFEWTDDVAKTYAVRDQASCPYCFTYCEFEVTLKDDYFWSRAALDAQTFGTTMTSAHVDITSPTFGLNDRFRHSFDEAPLSAVNYPGNNTEGTLLVTNMTGAGNVTWDENTTILHFWGGATFTLVMIGENDLVDDGDVDYTVYFDQVTVATNNNTGERSYWPGKPLELVVTNEDDETAGITWIQEYEMYSTQQLAGIMWNYEDDRPADNFGEDNLFGNGADHTDLYASPKTGKVPSTMDPEMWQRLRNTYLDHVDGRRALRADYQNYPTGQGDHHQSYPTFQDRNDRNKHWKGGQGGADRLRVPRMADKVLNTGTVEKTFKPYGGEADSSFTGLHGGTLFEASSDQSLSNYKSDGYEALANQGASNGAGWGAGGMGWGGLHGGNKLENGYQTELSWKSQRQQDKHDLNYSFTYTTYKNKRDPSDVWFDVSSACYDGLYAGDQPVSVANALVREHCHTINLPDNVTAEGGGNTTIGLFLMSQPTDIVFVRVSTDKLELKNGQDFTGLFRHEAIPVGMDYGAGIAQDKYSDYSVFRGPSLERLDRDASEWISGYEDEVTYNDEIGGHGADGGYYVPFTPLDYYIPKFVTIFGLDDMWDDYNQTFTVTAEVWDKGFKCDDMGAGEGEVGGGQRERFSCEAYTTKDKVYTHVDEGGLLQMAKFPMINVDDDDFDLFMDTDQHVTSEPDKGLSAVISVWLGTKPKATVLLSITSNVAAEARPENSLIAISSDDWTSKKEVLIESVDDQFKDGTIPYNITVAILFSNDEDYGGTTSNTENRKGMTALDVQQRFISLDDLADDSATACMKGYYGYFCKYSTCKTNNDWYNCKKCPQGTYKDQSGDSYDDEDEVDLTLVSASDTGDGHSRLVQQWQGASGTSHTKRAGSGCRMCPPGTYGVLEASQGMYNHEGWYNNKLVDLDPGCLPCGEGTYNDEWGATECKPCSQYPWPVDLHGPEISGGSTFASGQRPSYEGEWTPWCGPWGTVTPTNKDFSNKTSSYDTQWQLLSEASFSMTLTWATNPLDGSAWPGSMDEEGFANFLTQCAILIIMVAISIVCCVKKCGRKTDWQRFKGLIKKADVFKDQHTGGGGGDEEGDEAEEEEEEDNEEPQGEIIGGVMTLAFIVFLGGLLFIAAIMYLEYNAESTQVLMPKYASETYTIKSKFSLDLEVVGFTGCWNGTTDVDGKNGIGYPYQDGPHGGDGGSGGSLFDPIDVLVAATGLCQDPKVKGVDCAKSDSGYTEYFCTRREHLNPVQMERCTAAGVGGCSRKNPAPWQGHEAPLDPLVGSTFIQASGVNNLWIHWEATDVYVAVAPRITVYIEPMCRDFHKYKGRDGKFKTVGDDVLDHNGDTIETCPDCETGNSIMEPSHCLTVSAIGYFYTIRTNSIYGDPYLAPDVNSILKIIPQYDDNALTGYMSAGFPGNTRFRGDDESVVTIAIIPEYYSDNYNSPACDCDEHNNCQVLTDCPAGSARQNVKFYRLQYVSEEAGSRVDFGTHAQIFNSSSIALNDVQVVGSRQEGGQYANFGDAECRAVDFLDTTSDCYIKYKNSDPNGFRQGVTDLEDTDIKRYFIDPVKTGKDGTGVDSKEGAPGNPKGNGENGATIGDQLIFSVAFQESQVQLMSSIDPIQTWQDVMGSIGGFVAVAMALVVNLMQSIETSIDPDGPIAEKMKKLGDVAKSTGQRAAKAGGVNMAEETPDVIFSEDVHLRNEDVEMPNGEDDFDLTMGNQPDFDSLVLMSQLPNSRSTRSEVSSVSIVGGGGSARSVTVSAGDVTQI